MGWPQNAYVGQKVVCVYASDTNCVKEGKVYTIEGIDATYFYLHELEKSALCYGGMFKHRFRPIQSTETGMAILHQALQPNCKVRETEDA